MHDHRDYVISGVAATQDPIQHKTSETASAPRNRFGYALASGNEAPQYRGYMSDDAPIRHAVIYI